MKPFNLEAAKAGKPLVTRYAEAAKFIAFVPEADESCQLVVLIGDRVYGLHADGKSLTANSAYDLFMAEEEITVYFNQYADGSFGCVRHNMAEAAESNSSLMPAFVKTHAVKIKV